METFATEEELRGFLAKIDPVYSKYSNALFMAGVHNASIIDTADVTSFTLLGIPRMHAANLIARCKGTGVLLSLPMLRYSAHVSLNLQKVVPGKIFDKDNYCTLYLKTPYHLAHPSVSALVCLKHAPAHHVWTPLQT